MGNQDIQDRNWTNSFNSNSFKSKAQDKRGEVKQVVCDFNQIPGQMHSKYSTLNISSKNWKSDGYHEDEGDLSKQILHVYGPIAKIIDEKSNKIVLLLFDIEDMIKIQRESKKIGTFCQKYQELVKIDEIGVVSNSNGHNTRDMDDIMTIGQDFLEYLSFCVTHILEKQYIARIENKIQVLAMEYLSYVVFGKRLGLLSIDPELHVEKFLNAREDFISEFKNHNKCSKHFSTLLVNEFIHSTYESDIINMFTEELYNNSNSSPTGILNYLFESSDKSCANQVLNLKDKIKLTLNFVFSGTEYISNLILFLLYKLWENDVIQSRLFCHPQGQVDVEYFTACFKEALRLLPSKKNFARRVESDVNIQGFRIPKGTVVVNEFELACKDKQFFQPNNFLPERWLINNGGHCSNDPTEEMEFFWQNNFYYSDIISWKDIFNLSAQIIQAYKMEFIDFKLEVNEANLLYCVNESSKVKIERF